MKHGLLNPPVEAAACRRMIATVQNRLQQLEAELSSMVFDRETYLQKIGGANELRAQKTTLEQIYAKEFEV